MGILFKSNLITAAMLTVIAGFVSAVSAQPTDAQVKRDLTGPRTVTVVLGKPGAREWSSTYKKYVWNRNFTAKLKTEDPQVFVIVKGYASYDIVGGRFVFWRTFTTSNSYEGLSNPTAADVQSMLATFGLEQFMGNYHFNRILGKIESIGLSEEPKFQWHTPNSVSFNVAAIYTEKTNDIGGKERVARTFEIRLYRDHPKQAWLRMLSTAREKKTL